MKKLRNTEAWLKKNVAYKKKRVNGYEKGKFCFLEKHTDFVETKFCFVK